MLQKEPGTEVPNPHSTVLHCICPQRFPPSPPCFWDFFWGFCLFRLPPTIHPNLRPKGRKKERKKETRKAGQNSMSVKRESDKNTDPHAHTHRHIPTSLHPQKTTIRKGKGASDFFSRQTIKQKSEERKETIQGSSTGERERERERYLTRRRNQKRGISPPAPCTRDHTRPRSRYTTNTSRPPPKSPFHHRPEAWCLESRPWWYPSYPA